MIPGFLISSTAGEGFLNLFMNLLLLTSISGVLLLISRKWSVPTRSFLLMGIILCHVFTIGWNLAFLWQPHNRISVVSLDLPVRENLAPLHVSTRPIRPLDSMVSSGQIQPLARKPSTTREPSWSRFIVPIASWAGVIWLGGSVLFMGMLIGSLVSLSKFQQRLIPLTDNGLQITLKQVTTRLCLNKQPLLFYSSELDTPITIGLLNPNITYLNV